MRDMQIHTVHEIADYLRVSIQTVLREIHFKKLEAYKVSGTYRISDSAFQKYLEEIKTTTVASG